MSSDYNIVDQSDPDDVRVDNEVLELQGILHAPFHINNRQATDPEWKPLP